MRFMKGDLEFHRLGRRRLDDGRRVIKLYGWHTGLRTDKKNATPHNCEASSFCLKGKPQTPA